MAEHPALEDELRELGLRLHAAPVPDPAGVAGAVRARLESPHAARARALPRLRWLATAAVVALVAILAGTPAGRAAVVEVLRFAGVEVRHEPGPASGFGATPSGPGLLPGQTRTGLSDARARAAFPVYVPEALGRPDAVTVSGGDPPRVVSLIYRDGGIRLDEFGGELVPYFRKFAARDDAEMVRIDGQRALWVRGPHEVVYVDRQGDTRTESARLAGNTLIWQEDGATLRLEGDLSRAHAITVAESVR